MKRSRFIEEAFFRLLCAQPKRKQWLKTDEHARQINADLLNVLKGEKMLIGSKDGKIVCVRAKSTYEALSKWERDLKIDELASVI